ncbi:amphoterin-induced protein 1-like [Mytilus trossulus]|uniref:amphoterin-induced protein 1-like n=1 Tax=Mytilus trossulus TaxID=6551 RepID=UPI003006C151
MDLTHIPADCPSNTTSLYLSNNNLDIISRKAFTKYAELRYLDISGCHMTTIDQSAFDNLSHLKELRMSPLDDLQVLHISHDLLSTSSKESWSDFHNITKVFSYGGPSNGSFAEIFL